MIPLFGRGTDNIDPRCGATQAFRLLSEKIEIVDEASMSGFIDTPKQAVKRVDLQACELCPTVESEPYVPLDQEWRRGLNFHPPISICR